jgi:hypothetical protein
MQNASTVKTTQYNLEPSKQHHHENLKSTGVNFGNILGPQKAK